MRIVLLRIDQLQGTCRLTSLAQGVPIGGELDYLDDGTITAEHGMGRLRALIKLGSLASFQREFDAASARFEESLAIGREHGYRREIAIALGIDLGTVKSRLNRARKRLRQALKDVYDA